MEEKLNSFDLKQIISYSIESESKSKEFYGKFVEAGKGQLVPVRFKSLMEHGHYESLKQEKDLYERGAESSGEK